MGASRGPDLGRDSQGGKKVTKVYLNIPYLTLILCYKLRKSYRDPKGCIANFKQ